MTRILPHASAEVGAESLDRDVPSRSSVVDLLDLLRQAMVETHWSETALSAHMGHKDASYVGRVLRREKPLGASFLMALPDDLDTKFAALHAEARGQIVVVPLRGEDAIRMFAAGLLGLFAAQAALPARASKMAHAAVTTTAKRKVG